MNRFSYNIFWIVVVCALFPYAQIHAQDEQFMRDFFMGQLHKQTQEPQRDPTYRKASAFYEIDLTRDRRFESLVYEKQDGQDWLHIHDTSGQRVYSYRFETKGPNSRLYKVQMQRLSPLTDVLLLYFFEGEIDSIEFHASSRLYFLTIDHQDLSTISTFKGPSVWDESTQHPNSYWKRKYSIGLKDLSNDLVKEVIVKQGQVSRIFKYIDFSEWIEIR